MVSNLRSSRARPDPGGHMLSVHASRADVVDSVSAWVLAGLERHDKVVLLPAPAAALADVPATAPASPASPASPAFPASPAAPVGLPPRPAPAAAQGRSVHVLPAAGVLSEVAIARLLGEALEEGYAGLRVCADVEAGLDVLGTRGYEEFELSADRLCRTRRLSVLCLYSAARTVGAVLRGATAAHSGGLRAPGVLTRATGPGELLVEGDVDPVNGPAVAAAVLAAPATTEGDLRVDLSRLGLLGSAGVRALLDGSRPLRAAGGRLVLHRVPSHAERVLRSCAVDSVAGVRWTEGAA